MTYIDTLDISLDENTITFNNDDGTSRTYGIDAINHDQIFGISDSGKHSVVIYYQGERYSKEELDDAGIDLKDVI